jgi:sulfur-oxidizing protein SoxY
MTHPTVRSSRMRRHLLKSAGLLAFARWFPAGAAEVDVASIPELGRFLAGRTPRWERIDVKLPQLADNGQAVPMKISVAGPFAPGPEVRSIRLYSEKNPVPLIAIFEFQMAVPRVEVESRVRLAGTQHLVAVATMSDGTLLAGSAEVIVTIAACLDGT